MRALTPEQIRHFQDNGWVAISGALDPITLEALQAWVGQVSDWGHEDGPGLHHFEQTGEGSVRIARSEDLIPHHPGLRGFICGEPLLERLGQLFGEPAILYKEKINYKHPGGGGFAPHQDSTAYRFIDHHISVMVPLDPATTESGGLEFAPGHTRGTLPNTAGQIEPAVSAALDWRAVDALPGDIVFFDSYAPHRSGTNTSSHARRALYLTYNARSKGDLRDRYYQDKRREFAREGASFDGERTRISVNDDFLGKHAERPAKRSTRTRPLSELATRYASQQAHQLYDEAITELEHALQCAELAEQQGLSKTTVAAALLHDVGHLLIGDYFAIDEALDRDWKHEEVGARYLARWFGPEVTEPVRMHVSAKRYLCAVDADYEAALSPSSTRSLAVQGGAMSPAEVAAFEGLPGFQDAVAVRRLDDTGKVPDMTTRGFSDWMPLLRELAHTQQ